jgi:phosphatidylserine/phosphatidylglycerophosphate/cardiolipin synthase-like enzyme
MSARAKPLPASAALQAKDGAKFEPGSGVITRGDGSTVTMNNFMLGDLAVFFLEGEIAPSLMTSNSVQLFTQRDHAHECLVALHRMTTLSIVDTMFGYDDDELDQLIRDKLADPHIFVQLSLDRSQSGGAHEKAILAQWSNDGRANSVAVGTSAAGAIAHMKAGVLDGRIVFDGSTNWSPSGEGEAGAKAQNNSLVIFDSHPVSARYRTQLDIDHDTMLKQMAKRAAATSAANPPAAGAADAASAASAGATAAASADADTAASDDAGAESA